MRHVTENVVPITRGRRFTTRATVPRGESEFVGFRCAIKRIRQMDEIVASRFFPEIKTRSDILQDAVVMWIDKYYEENPQAPGHLKWQMTRIELNRTMRDADYEQAERMIRRGIHEKDHTLLVGSLPALHRIRLLFETESASPVEMVAIKELIKDTEEAIRGTT